jgi:hypothetical protein
MYLGPASPVSRTANGTSVGGGTVCVPSFRVSKTCAGKVELEGLGICDGSILLIPWLEGTGLLGDVTANDGGP